MSTHLMHLLALSAPRRWRSSDSGRLVVRAATVWITRDGDPDDHVLQPGESLQVREGDWLTAEPWHGDAPARLVFESTRPPHWSAALRRWFWVRVAQSAAALAQRLQGVAGRAARIATAG